MNRNHGGAHIVTWHTPLGAQVSIASYGDDGSVAEAELRALLSTSERAQAAALSDATEIRHFIARRSFQRLFLSQMTNFEAAPGDLSLIHRRDSAPSCPDAPDLFFSFSSSSITAVACASTSGPVGIDIERSRKIENVSALAQRHFTPHEAQTLALLPASRQGPAFLHYWTAKEAGLKAIGQGIVFGLNTFTLIQKDHKSFSIQGPPEQGGAWSLSYPDILPGHVIALVQKISAEKADLHL